MKKALYRDEIPETCCLYQLVQKVPKLTGETWNTFGVLIQFFKISTAICFSDNIEVDKKGLHLIFVYVIFQIFGSEFC